MVQVAAHLHNEGCDKASASAPLKSGGEPCHDRCDISWTGQVHIYTVSRGVHIGAGMYAPGPGNVHAHNASLSCSSKTLACYVVNAVYYHSNEPSMHISDQQHHDATSGRMQN